MLYLIGMNENEMKQMKGNKIYFFYIGYIWSDGRRANCCGEESISHQPERIDGLSDFVRAKWKFIGDMLLLRWL